MRLGRPRSAWVAVAVLWCVTAVRADEGAHGCAPPMMCCGGVLHGTWDREFLSRAAFNDSEITVENWHLSPEKGTCDLQNLDLEPILERLRGRRLVFIGDSLLRNLGNWMMDFVSPNNCSASKRTFIQVNGHATDVRHPTRFRNKFCRTSWVKPEPILWPERDITTQFFFFPWMEPWQGHDCEAELGAFLPTKGLEFKAPYFHSQTRLSCSSLGSVLSKISKKDPGSLFVINYTLITLVYGRDENFLSKELPQMLEPLRHRVLVVGHQDKMFPLLEPLRERNIRFVWYGNEEYLPKPVAWYDVVHPAGPPGVAAAIAALSSLADLAAVTNLPPAA